MKIIFIGDIVGKIGRKGLAKILPEWKEKHKPDVIIANAENISHGSGVSPEHIAEMQHLGIDFFTSGNHVFKRKDALAFLQKKDCPVLRPANFPPMLPGRGYQVIPVGAHQLIVINLMGRVFFREQADCPFRAFDAIYQNLQQDFAVNMPPIFLDFHAEATSEKRALQEYVDGKVAVIVGTHTHVPTADHHISDKGTAKVTDAGMVGAKHSVIGVKTDIILENFLKQFSGSQHEIPEEGLCQIGALLINVDSKKKQATSIKRIDTEVEV